MTVLNAISSMVIGSEFPSIFSSSPKLENEETSAIATLAAQMGINGLHYTEGKESSDPITYIPTFFGIGKKGVSIDTEAMEHASENQRPFLRRRVLCEIKSYNEFKIKALGSLISMISTVVLTRIFPGLSKIRLSKYLAVFIPISAAAGIAAVVGGIASMLISRRLAKHADIEAFNLCSEEEKKGALEYLEALRNKNLEDRQDRFENVGSRFTNLTTSEDGDDYLAFEQPAVTKRIAYLKALLSDR